MNILVKLAEYANEDGGKAVYLIVYVKKTRVRFNTGVKCPSGKWDEKNEKIKGSTKEIRDDNLVIQKCKSQLNEIFVRYRLENRIHEITPILLKKEYQNPSLSIDFYIFMARMIIERKGEITNSSMIQHEATLSKLKGFKESLFFSEINPLFIENFARYLKVKLKNKPSTVYNTLKNLRTYLNMAKRRGIIKKSPFEEMKIKRVKSDPEVLNEKELSLLWKKYQSNFLTGSHQHILRAFLFCCFTGLRISDLIRASHDWIIGNSLVFQPLKTKNTNAKTIKIPLTQKALKLIEDSGTSFGPLFKTYSEQKMREWIKAIATHCGIHKKISWHSSRHTFGSLFIEKTNDVATLQNIMGHGNISQTMIYVHINEKKKTDQMKTFDKKLNV